MMQLKGLEQYRMSSGVGQRVHTPCRVKDAGVVFRQEYRRNGGAEIALCKTDIHNGKFRAVLGRQTDGLLDSARYATNSKSVVANYFIQHVCYKQIVLNDQDAFHCVILQGYRETFTNESLWPEEKPIGLSSQYRSFRYIRNKLARQQVPHRAVMPLPTARRPHATSVERSGNGTRGCRTRRLYLAHDGQHVGREGVRACFVRRRALGLSLGQIGAVAQLRAGRLLGREGNAGAVGNQAAFLLV